MKATLSMLLLAFATTCASAQTSEVPAVPKPLQTADCINTRQINSWSIVDARTAIVRTGPKYYQVNLKADCPQLSHPPGLIFRSSGNNNGMDNGRICGAIGETVRSRGQPQCAIESVVIIDKARYNELNGQSRMYKDSATKASAPMH